MSGQTHLPTPPASNSLVDVLTVVTASLLRVAPRLARPVRPNCLAEA